MSSIADAYTHSALDLQPDAEDYVKIFNQCVLDVNSVKRPVTVASHFSVNIAREVM
jgi:hypothetical protein